jgi:hypothetical protein
MSLTVLVIGRVIFFYVYQDLSLTVKSETQYMLSFLLVLQVYHVCNNMCL